MSTETAVAAISACAAVLALALALLAWQAMRHRSDRRFEAVLERLDGHLAGISSSLERVVERAEGVRARGVAALELAVDFDDLLRRVAVEAATRTGADGAAVQVVGPDGEPRSASFGAVSSARSLDAPLAQATGEFRAVTINWSYRPGAGAEDPVSSALVVPIVEDGRETGTISAYAPASAAFGPEHVGVLESLAAESGPGLAAARGFAVAQRELTDTVTGLRSPKGYDLELQRAVDRARETGRPLSLLILGPDDIADVDSPATDVLRELAGLLVRTTRGTDVVCRRDETQFGILLPDTGADPARRLYGRLLEAAQRTTFGTARQLTFASGLVEWRPNESGRALDARALAAVGRTRTEASAFAATEAVTATAAVEPSLRDVFQDRLAREVGRARHLERPLALLLVHVDGIARIAEAHGATAAERVLEEVESRLRELIGSGEIGARVRDDSVAVIHPGSQAARAEELFSALRSSLESDPATHLDRLALSAGVSELSAGDDAHGLLARTEHALARAERAGSGTVVVETAAGEAQD